MFSVFSYSDFFFIISNDRTCQKWHVWQKTKPIKFYFMGFGASSRTFKIVLILLFRNTSINTSPVCEWWKDLHAWCEPECMTYLQSKPILTTPMSTSPSSMSSSISSSSPGSNNVAEEFFNKDVQVVNTIKQLQRGAKSISVTFTSIDK